MRDRLRIIVVDGTTLDLRVLGEQLEQHGISAVCEAVATEDALRDALAHAAPNLVVTGDGTSGPHLEALQRQLRPWFGSLPWLVLSPGATPDLTVHLLEVGAWDVVLEGRALPVAVYRNLREARRSKPVALEASPAPGGLCLSGAGSESSAQQEVQQLYESLFRRNPFPMALSTAEDLRFVDVNFAFLKRLGFDPGEVLGKTATELGILSGPEAQQRIAQRLEQEGNVLDEELQIQTRGGESRYALFNAQRLQIQGRSYLLTVMSDITERRQMETALRESEERFRRLFANAPDAVLELDAASARFLSANAAAVKLWGCRGEAELIGRTPWELSPELQPDGRASAAKGRELIEAAIQKGLQSFEWVHRRLEGEEFLAVIQLVRTEHAGRTCLQATIRDETESRRAQAALQDRERLLRLALEVGKIGAFEVELATGRSTWTREVEEIWGLPPGFSGDLQRYCWEHVHPQDIANAAALYTSFLHEAKERDIELRIVRPDGTIRWLRWLGRPLRDDTGAVVRITGVNLDITDHHQLELERENALAKYRTLFEAMPVGITVADRHGRIVESNLLAQQLLGIPREQQADRHIGGPEWRIVRPDGTPMPPDEFASIRALREQRVVANVEMGIVKSPSEITWITVTAAPVPQHDLGVVIAYVDVSSQKRSEAALRENLWFRREAERIARIGAWKVNPETDFLYWTEGTYAIVEAPLDYRPGLKEGLRFYDPEAIPVIQAALLAALRDGAPFAIEVGLTTATGRHLWTEVRGLGRVVEGGESFVMGTLQDITERKRADERAARDVLRTEFLLDLHQRAPHLTDRELYDEVLEQAVRLTESEIGFFHRVSEDQREIQLTTWNKQALRTCTAVHDTHYPMDRAGNWVDCVREQRPIVYNDFAASPHQRGLPQGHTPVRRFMSIPVVRDGKVQIIFGVGNKATDYNEADLTQLQVVANELHKVMTQRAAEHQLRQLSRAVEQSPTSVVITDTAGDIVYANPRFTETSGYALNEVLGKNPRIFRSGEMGADQVRALWQTILGGRAWHGEFHNRKKNGELYWESASISPITDPATGRITHFVAVKEDVTERKRLEDKLRQSQKLEAVGQLAGGVAHDFNNILGAIMMQLGLLQMSPSLDEESLQLAREIEGEAGRAASLTRQLLMFSRRSMLEVAPLNLNQVVAELLKMLGRLIGEQVKLLFDGYTGGLPAVAADKGMLEQVLVNLVVNARDAMPSGGCITIATGLAELQGDVLEGPGRQPGTWVYLSVSDTGVGMDEETQRHIFEPFFTTKEPGKGTGLGLATVHGIVAQHKGWVEVQSAVGKGTTFRVLLPAVADPSQQDALGAARTSLPRGTECILLVEDEPSLRNGLSQALRALGYRVHLAENAPQALSLWSTCGAEVDLLLTDMVMPESMTGLELAAKLRALKPSLKVVISSGYSAELVDAGGLGQSDFTYLPKPFSTQLLAETVRACLDSQVG